MPAPVVLLTDFGLADWYVAAMKGVLCAQAPGAPLVDLTHEVPPGDVARAAFVLARAHGTWPEDTVFLIVVDPGVGTARHPLAARAGGRYYVGPDNGVLEAALAAPGAVARRITDAALEARASATFHGRDLFAPAAARIALGGAAAWEALGPVLPAPVRLPAPRPAAATPGALVTRVAYVDRFGNAITTLDEAALDAWRAGRDARGLVITAEGAGGPAVIRGLARTYGDAAAAGPHAPPVALLGSSGLLEIAVPGGHAALRLGLVPGDPVTLRHE